MGANPNPFVPFGITIGMATTVGGTYTALLQLQDITPAPVSRDLKKYPQNDLANNPTNAAKYVSGMLNAGPVRIKCSYVPTDATLKAWTTAVTEFPQKTRFFKITMPDDTTGVLLTVMQAFEAFVQKWTPGTMNDNDEATCEFELQPTGAITLPT